MSDHPTMPVAGETWDLGDLFADDAAFDEARSVAAARLDTVDRFRGRLLESPAVLADALEALSDLQERLQALHCYASMRSDVDTRDPAHQARRQEVDLLWTRFAERSAFVRPEIVGAPAGTVERLLAEEQRLAPYTHYLRDLLRRRDHVLSPAEERILAETGLIRRDPASLYSVLTNAEIPRPELTLSTGETVRLTPARFHRHRTTGVRRDRLELFARYFEPYGVFRETLGLNLYSAIKGHVFAARARGYPSCLLAALDDDDVPAAVYRNLIEQVREALPLLHRYLLLRARALGLERVDYADLYCPLGRPPASRHRPGDAARLVKDALAPLGDAYRETLDAAFRSRWIDWHPTEGKRSGAYANGWAYRAHPYVLLNFTEDHDGVLTLAHEMGHALHSHFSNAAQPFPTAAYSIFVAEVASTFNEALVRGHLFERTTGAEERLFLVGAELDGIRGTLFRQTMFAEFELEIHERAERGEALTGERLSELYLALLRRYHGHDVGVMHVGEEYGVEWAAIPHMYYDFYVYQYATGIVAASALARGVLDGRDGALERYLRFLAAGGSDYPLSLLRDAGVDLERPEPFRETFRSVVERLDLLESALDAHGPATGR